MAETTFYFVRHGETEYNRRRIVQGRGVDTTLNGRGRAQAQAVARRLAEVPVDAVYASTLRRAVETAEVIAGEHAGLPVRQLADLEEMAWGVFEGQPFSDEMTAVFARYQAQWQQGVFGDPFEGGESILDVQARARRATDHLLAAHAGETLVVVTHGRLLRVLLATLLDAYGLARMHEIQHNNTGVNVLTWRAGRFEADVLNCTAHLAATPFSEAG